MPVSSNNIKPTPGLYIVATPIGNLKDITLRALDILSASEVIICEDTRVSHTLLSKYGIAKKLIAYNDHNAESVRPQVMAYLRDGRMVSLISDAGTPLISDPGYKLVALARENGFPVTAIPGACSVIDALTLSTLPTDSFLFDGFLPSKSGARKNRLKELRMLKSTLIFFDRSSRLPETLQDMHEILGDRKTAIARELTKKFEEVLIGKISELLKILETKDNLLGEMVVMVAGFDKDARELDLSELDNDIKKLKMDGVPVKTISEILAEKYPLTKKKIYARIGEIQG